MRTFTTDDLDRLVELVSAGWRTAGDRDWSARAGTLEWDCTATADHAVDTVLAPAMFLASRKQDGYPGFDWGPFTIGERATPTLLADALEAAGRILTAVVATAGPGARAAIWRRPVVEARGPADFVPRGGLELILHAHDVSEGLGVELSPPTDLCERLRSHTADWPFWTVLPGWQPLARTGDPWADLLRSSGRTAASR